MGGWVSGWVAGWVGGWVGGFGLVDLGGWVWVGLGGFTIISDFRGTCGSGGTVKQKQKSDTCAIHCAAHHFEMDAFFF